MNRREFLLSLLGVPFGWKALFGKEVKKEKDCRSMSEQEWNDRMDCRSAFLGGGEIGKADGSLFHALRKWQVVEDKDGCECAECNGGFPFPDWVADGMKSGTYFERTVEIPLDLLEPVIPDHANISGDDHIAVLFKHENGQCDPETYYVSLCNFIADIIDRDCSRWILPSGECTIDLSGVEVFISYDNGDAFWCPDINAEKTVWYRKAEELSHYGETWELIT